MPAITSHYAALLALLLFVLSVRVIQARVACRVAIGLGDDRRLLRASRAQSATMLPRPMVQLRESTTVTVASVNDRAASSALCIVA